MSAGIEIQVQQLNEFRGHRCEVFVSQDSGLARIWRQDEGCKLPMNRDRLGASNIGLNFCRLFRGETPMPTMSDEEREFHRLQIG